MTDVARIICTPSLDERTEVECTAKTLLCHTHPTLHEERPMGWYRAYLVLEYAPPLIPYGARPGEGRPPSDPDPGSTDPSDPDLPPSPQYASLTKPPFFPPRRYIDLRRRAPAKRPRHWPTVTRDTNPKRAFNHWFPPKCAQFPAKTSGSRYTRDGFN